MVDLLLFRVILGFLFSVVGVDIFGFWLIVICKIRGGVVESKWWVIMFMCLMIRVVYIELVEFMLSLLFINVLWRFIVFCGNVCELWFDCGINFIGVIGDFNIDVI